MSETTKWTKLGTLIVFPEKWLSLGGAGHTKNTRLAQEIVPNCFDHVSTRVVCRPKGQWNLWRIVRPAVDHCQFRHSKKALHTADSIRRTLRTMWPHRFKWSIGKRAQWITEWLKCETPCQFRIDPPKSNLIAPRDDLLSSRRSIDLSKWSCVDRTIEEPRSFVVLLLTALMVSLSYSSSSLARFMLAHSITQSNQLHSSLYGSHYLIIIIAECTTPAPIKILLPMGGLLASSGCYFVVLITSHSISLHRSIIFAGPFRGIFRLCPGMLGVSAVVCFI